MWWYPDWQSRQVLILVDEDFFLFIGEVIKMRDWPPGQPYRQGAIFENLWMYNFWLVAVIARMVWRHPLWVQRHRPKFWKRYKWLFFEIER
jgi:hypothetical protein